MVFGLWSVSLLLALLLPFRLSEAANPGGTTLPWIHVLVLLGLSLGVLWWWGGAPVLRHYWFPLFFLLTCVPWPGKVNDWVTQGLMHSVARVTVEVVGLFGIPAIAHGSTLDIATGTVGIDEACSGIRSLQTSIMLALLLGELFLLRPWKRILLLPFGMFVALAANLGRTTLLTWSAAKQGFDKMHEWHGPAGLAVVGTVMGGLYLLAWLWRERPGPEARSQRAEVGNQRSEVRDQRSEVSGQRSVVSGQKSVVPGPWSLVRGPVFLLLCCLWVPATEGLTWAWYHWPGKGPAAAAPWSIRWPTNQTGFADTPLPPRTVEILRCTEHKAVSWTDPQGNGWGLVWLYWPPGSNLEAYVGGHNPERCMSAGWALIKRVEPVAVNLGKFSMKFHHSLFQDGPRTMHVFRGTWEPFVPPLGQRLLPERGLRARIRDVLERRLIQGGITMEIALRGPATEQEADDCFQKEMACLVVTRR